MSKRSTKAPDNPGSAFGQAIGNMFQERVEKIQREVVERCGYRYHSGKDPLPGYRGATLRIRDRKGHEWQIDSAVTDQRNHVVIIGEVKYIQRAKHVTDKGSWICNCHSLLRQTYPTIRASIAVLAGGWSKPALKMIRDCGTEVFYVPYEDLVKGFSEKGITINWTDEGSAQASQEAWDTFSLWSEVEKEEIADKVVQSIAFTLAERIEKFLTDTTPRTVQSVEVSIKTNKGETIFRAFDTLQQAQEFQARVDFGEFFQE